MKFAIVSDGESRSFPAGDPFLARAVPIDQADVVIYVGGARHLVDAGKIAVLVELGCESLGRHTGESMGNEGSNVLGFARYRNGSDAPSPLVELVRQPNSHAAALASAREIFEDAKLTVAVCSDQAGRIVDRLVRPKYNVALRFLDEGLATQKDMDLTCRMGLGYTDGPIERAVRGGLADHYGVTQALFETYGSAGYAPARRAIVAAQRREDK